MKIGDILDAAQGRQVPDNDTRLSLEVLLAYVLQKPREFLLAHPEYQVEEKIERRFMDLIARFFEGEPVAYLTGMKEFFGLSFMVDRRVLIPRPETELMVEKVLSFAQERTCDKPFVILDIGTGSGCIAISLAKSLPHACITASDVSREALEVAAINARNHGVADRITFVHSDLLESVEGSFDVVVANLPYIGEERHRFISREAFVYEPHVALFGGVDGLRLYEKLFQQMKQKGWRPEFLLGEFGFLQGNEIRELMNKFFVQDECQIVKDYASIERMFVIRSH